MEALTLIIRLIASLTNLAFLIIVAIHLIKSKKDGD